MLSHHHYANIRTKTAQVQYNYCAIVLYAQVRHYYRIIAILLLRKMRYRQRFRTFSALLQLII